MTINRIEKFENLIMIEVLKVMQTLGGRVTRKEVKREICDHSEVISEEQVDEVKYSKKTDVPYHSFNYRFNFTVKYLIAADFIITEDNRNLELLGKGRVVKPEDFDPIRDVRAVLSENSANDTEVDEDTETGEEPLKAELLDALAKIPPQKFEMFSRGLLIDRGMKKKELQDISAASIAKLGRNGNVTVEILVKVCQAFNCDINDICEIVHIDNNLVSENVTNFNKSKYYGTFDKGLF